ncbi:MULTISPECIES: FdhF/YdeP family oxidoreductase [Pantoea]|jgi:molybdopterin-dependent oxidoreductase alpha subunit|uniref:FdhF/YdeP family oxidoreductase n=1 Tax=Pantoea eucrina TaxID=472693 RepID=A0ABS1Z652_9GAMM|nr:MULTISPECIES: FdhF/YdeP family oxidoreductase [Pantoea]AJA71101.1 CbbBc protein [Pantoea sp. PSNIH1]QNH53005.1 FdhF/YdeP family oxidoreductase [Acinetobacter venetianus]MBM0747601.1 FdhF/YdeP family oxidoreductase [Pantoea eucrina]MCL9648693.1 FdhF/YdeP family oxidoreductase [Pantoea eucrina]MDJ0023470.1 FdhF/YdeP family oxidoreductase [Pantoea eucrina]
MKEQNRDVGIKPYGGSAGGWGALKAVADAIRRQMAVKQDVIALFKVNQPEGFDCPGCAWPDPRHASSFEFCENGAKAVSWEATSKRTTPAFFAAHTVSELWQRSAFELEGEGRLTHPMKYDAVSDTYQPIEWETALQEIGALLRGYDDPDSVEFYTSGRASNEAAFLWQLFAREYGTNNFPDCSNMCHEPTSVGLPESIGVGKGTVELEDFDHADLVICIGHNPGTNHPRMLGTLREVSKRGAKIVAINPLRERGLERFTSPQSPIEMLSMGSTQLASTYYKVRVGGDAAMLKGVMKTLLAMHDNALEAGEPPVLDETFIREHTEGFAALKADLDDTSWDHILKVSGMDIAEIQNIAHLYAAAENTIICYGMGITQHQYGTQNVQQIANLLLLRGNIGRRGAGICPLRGHSNVQGDRTVGITEIPSQTLLDSLQKVFGFTPPQQHGHGAVAAIQAIRDGRSKALLCLGGNLAEAISDPQITFEAMRKLDLVVHMATKLNRSHLLMAKHSYLLPVLGRTERDRQASGDQSVTVEDSMSMVHASRGTLEPASPHLKSEPALVAGLAKATLPASRVNWDKMVSDYSNIRDAIEAVFPAFENFNQRVMQPGGFRLYNAASERVWLTPSKRAQFKVMQGINEDPRSLQCHDLVLTTLRSHDQYNTTLYGLNDRYRGITGRRDVLFISADEAESRQLRSGDTVNMTALDPQGNRTQRRMENLTLVIYDMAPGSVAAYYPEANIMVPLDSHDTQSGIPAYKSIPVVIEPSGAAQADSSGVLR